ncbi:hypothetical protein BH20CHL6_BH20CHL6_04990 [soil metagenome]|jgi:hypothetical protein
MAIQQTHSAALSGDSRRPIDWVEAPGVVSVQAWERARIVASEECTGDPAPLAGDGRCTCPESCERDHANE